MDKFALIFADSDTVANSIKKLLSDEGYNGSFVADNLSKAKDALKNRKYDIICVAMTNNGNALDFCKYAVIHSSAAVFLFVQSQIAESISSEAEDCGIIVIPVPVSRKIFHISLKMTLTAEKRYKILKTENDRLKNQVEEIKLINRAKLVLIEYLSMSEKSAHRYIEKQAMDMRVSKTEIAKQILKMYEN